MREALANGYRVRSIARSEEKGTELLRQFPDPGHSVVHVKDILYSVALKKGL